MLLLVQLGVGLPAVHQVLVLSHEHLVVDRPVLIQGQLGLYVGLSLDRVADLLRGVEGAALPSVDLVPLGLELIPDHRSADISVMAWLMEPAGGELVWAMDWLATNSM